MPGPDVAFESDCGGGEGLLRTRLILGLQILPFSNYLPAKFESVVSLSATSGPPGTPLLVRL